MDSSSPENGSLSPVGTELERGLEGGRRQLLWPGVVPVSFISAATISGFGLRLRRRDWFADRSLESWSTEPLGGLLSCSSFLPQVCGELRDQSRSRRIVNFPKAYQD